MAHSLTASKKVMQNYLSELLTDSDAESLEKKKVTTQNLVKSPRENPSTKLAVRKDSRSLEKLLETVSDPVIEQNDKLIELPETTVDIENTPLSTHKSRAESVSHQDKEYRQGDFQAMFFSVAGLTIAVPLIELGGIHKAGKTTSLMGKPDWFKGVMLHREDKINVVDTALWVMPEKCDDKLIESLDYQYTIMLNDSLWGLMAEHLVDTVVLRQDEVKWLDSDNKRPWLAGLVKDKMCALLDVSALIELLDEGIDIHQK